MALTTVILGYSVYGQVLPIVFEALYQNSRAHWNSTVHGLTCNVVKLFMEMDSTLFDQCSNEYRQKQEKLGDEEAKRKVRMPGGMV